jgi:hypothetical protein
MRLSIKQASAETRQAEAAIQAALQSVAKCYRKQLLITMKEAVFDRKALAKFKHMPVDVTTFIEDEYYMNAKGTIYPEIMKHLVEMNEGDYDEIVCTGGIGAGKSTVALYTTAYQLYLLSCMANPQRYFGLDPTHEILIVFQSLNKALAEELDYERFKQMIKASKYFTEQFTYNRHVETQLEFPNRIVVKPVSGAETGAIGQNVIGGLIDEVNFMANVQKSSKNEGQNYDQATALYNSVARRRKSRFMNKGRLPGRLCLVSSRRHPGQFTDIKEEEAKSNPRIYIYDKRVWEVKPDGYSGETFRVFIGDDFRKPYVLDKDAVPSDADIEAKLVDTIPIEYWSDFAGPKADIIKALRDIAGKSTLARHPLMQSRELVAQCFGRRHSIFASDCTDFVSSRPQIRGSLIGVNREHPRWAHIDLGLTSDHAGVTIGHVPRFVDITRGDGIVEVLPHVEIDGFLEIPPPHNGEIDFASIRMVLYKLREMGLPIRWVSMDSFQSVDSMQILRSKGFVVGYQSIDTNTTPYELTKQALYDNRVTAPTCKKVIKELLSLERDTRTGKIDHPANGSKDVADSFAGVVYGLTTRREVWGQHRVALMQTHSLSSLIRDQKPAEGNTRSLSNNNQKEFR